MANRRSFNQHQLQHKNLRRFSEELKLQAVRDIERGAFTPGEVSRLYEVSRTSVYRWIYRYSTKLVKGTYQIVEKESQTAKIKALEQRIKELEHLVGTKQIQLEFSEKMLELGSELVGFDIKKKFDSQASATTGKTGKK